MSLILEELREPLGRRTLEALNRKALHNRGTFAAFKLPGAAQTLVAALLGSENSVAQARTLGAAFGKQGLSLASVLEAQTAANELVNGLESFADREALHQRFSSFYNTLIEGLVEADRQELEQQRTQMEQAFLATTTEQREAERALRHAISELSTPIIPVAEGILVLPLVGSIDSRRASDVNERLLEGIAEHQAEIVIIDITGVPMMDTATANLLLMTARAAGLLGSRVVLCGIGAEIAQTISHLGVDLRALTTLANLQVSIAYALKRRGLQITAI